MTRPYLLNILGVSVLLVLTVALMRGRAEPAAAWPQFRGPGSLGLAETARIPERWSRTENVAWVSGVPGRGWSSPVVWGHRVFVTTAISPGAFKEPSTGIYGNDYIAELRKQGLPPDEVSRRVRARDNESPDEVGAEVVWRLLCFDAASGRLLWDTEVHRGRPFGGRHRKNTYASETPATEYKLLGVNTLGEMSLATPAVVADGLFVRTATKLYRIGGPEKRGRR